MSKKRAKTGLNNEELKELLLKNPDLVKEAFLEIKKNEKIAKVGINKYEDIQLSAGQESVLQSLFDFVNEKNKNFFVLKGYAGTGKTFIILYFIREFIKKGYIKKIAVTATTNKAVKVLITSSVFNPNLVSFKTVHSLLGITEDINDDGEIIFKPQKQFLCDIQNYDIVFIDETSMLDTKLFQILIEYKDTIKFIFVGDPAQTPPVGEICSPVFDDLTIKKYNMQVMELDEIVRQKKGSPIISIATNIRTNLHSITRQYRRENIDTEEEGVKFLTFRNEKEKKDIYEVVRSLYCSKEYEKNSEYVKVVAWRNEVVNNFNKSIRKMIFGADAGILEIGEKLIANSPIIINKIIVFTTNDEFDVCNFKEKIFLYKKHKLNYYSVTVRYFNVFTNKYEISQIRILHESEQMKFEEIKEDIRAQALALGKGSELAKRKWREYYDFMRYFADVSYAYSITCHKSQGSTYENCIVYEDDIDKNQNIFERNRIKYTAFTRPKKNLFIIGN